MKRILLSALTFMYLAAGGYAGGFSLNAVSLANLKDGSGVAGAAIPLPAAPFAVPQKTTPPGLAAEMTIKIPFSEINKRMAGLTAMMKVLEPSKPVFSRRENNIVFTNVTIDYHGVEAEPTVLLNPVFESNNRLAVHIVNMDAIADFGPKSMDGLNKDGLLAAIADGLIGSITKSMDEAFLKNKVGLKAADLIAFSYDQASWTLYAEINPNFVAPMLPGLTSDITLTAFNFDDAGFTLGVNPCAKAAMDRMSGYNLALSDGLIAGFLRKFAQGSAYELNPRNYNGGLRFGADGRISVAVKTTMADLPLKPDVYASLEFTPALTAPNTLALRFEKVTVDRAYGITIPDAVNGLIQSKVLALIVDGIASNKELAKTMSARKTDARTVELKFRNSALLSTFAKGAAIDRLKVTQGSMYLGFEF